ILKSAMNNLSIDGINIIFNHSNVSPENFGILLRYIYGGNIELTNYDIPEILNILMVADKLGLTDLCDYIQDQLLDSKKELLKQNFVFVNRTSLSYGFEKLSTFCNEVLKQEPKIIF
ncbi:24849_t:CDS:2, partial [Dentiscutata erythropus]